MKTEVTKQVSPSVGYRLEKGFSPKQVTLTALESMIHNREV